MENNITLYYFYKILIKKIMENNITLYYGL